VPADKSLFFYGSVYHRFLDPLLAEARRVAAGLIPPGSSVLDIACGTGTFCFLLKKERGCQVAGVDLSMKMIDFARRSSPYPDIRFLHEDATDLRVFADISFDCCTILMLMHELTRAQRAGVLKEALRVARSAIIIDSVASLPRNAGGLGIRLVEATLGRDHNPNFKAFLAAGGIASIFEDCGRPVSVVRRIEFFRGCREAVVVTALSP
jgi:ubiquinone/menaquinone biosynthesis C-methylase UbiE